MRPSLSFERQLTLAAMLWNRKAEVGELGGHRFFNTQMNSSGKSNCAVDVTESFQIHTTTSSSIANPITFALKEI